MGLLPLMVTRILIQRLLYRSQYHLGLASSFHGGDAGIDTSALRHLEDFLSVFRDDVQEASASEDASLASSS